MTRIFWTWAPGEGEDPHPLPSSPTHNVTLLGLLPLCTHLGPLGLHKSSIRILWYNQGAICCINRFSEVYWAELVEKSILRGTELEAVFFLNITFVHCLNVFHVLAGLLISSPTSRSIQTGCAMLEVYMTLLETYIDSLEFEWGFVTRRVWINHL